MKPEFQRLLPAFFPLLAAFFLSPLEAAPVSIGDASFEDNSLSAGTWSNELGPEWTGTDGPISGNAFEECISGFAANGSDHLGMESGYEVWQNLGVTYQPNTRYTLTIAAGNRSGATTTGNQTQYLLADSVGNVYATGSIDAYANVPADTFADAPSLVFDSPNNLTSIGKTIRVQLRSGGVGRSHFDHIRLDAAPISNGLASVTNQAATSITASGATLNGAITAIGASTPTVTLFWGSTDGGFVPANWEHSIALSGTQAGSFSSAITGLTPNTTYIFTCRATNASGDSWPSSSAAFETPPLPPTVANLAATNISATTAIVGANVSSTGGENPAVSIYYGTTDGGTNTASWATSVSLGTGSGPMNTTLTGLQPGTTYYIRAFASNSGGQSWAAPTASFTTNSVVLPTVEVLDADGVTGSTANLKGKVTGVGSGTPSVTLYYGSTNGGTNAGSWSNSASLGAQDGDFSRFVSGLNPNTLYYFRYRATNASGSAWSADTGSFTTTALIPSTAVINEFHYNPLDSTSHEEFIELHNPGDTAINLSGWTLSDAVTYTFPNGTTLPARGYVVVAENPTALQSKYAITGVLGPWTGKLSSQGEKIVLKNSSAVTVDSVDYGAGFPWPTGADGAGPSAELIHPGLDNDLGGSWRSSYNPGSTGTSYELVPGNRARG